MTRRFILHRPVLFKHRLRRQKHAQPFYTLHKVFILEDRLKLFVPLSFFCSYFHKCRTGSLNFLKTFCEWFIRIVPDVKYPFFFVSLQVLFERLLYWRNRSCCLNPRLQITWKWSATNLKHQYLMNGTQQPTIIKITYKKDEWTNIKVININSLLVFETIFIHQTIINQSLKLTRDCPT